MSLALTQSDNSLTISYQTMKNIDNFYMNPQQMIMCTQLYSLQDLCVSIVYTRCGAKCHTKMTEPCGDDMWHIVSHNLGNIISGNGNIAIINLSVMFSKLVEVATL